MKNTIVINLFGAPSAGKSTAAAYLFYNLKLLNVNCELVTEFAKDLVWEESNGVQNQAYVFGQQSYRMSRLDNKVDVIITDSPLLLSVYYGKHNWNTRHHQFADMVVEDFNNYNNYNYFINRVKKYNPVGRFQNEQESDAIANDLAWLLEFYNIDFKVFEGSEEGYQIILSDIIYNLQEKGILK